MKTRRIVLLGPPGSGKGTQAAKIAARLQVPHIATGDLFREEIAAQTELGVLADSFIAHGNLVPDEVTNQVVRERLAAPDAAGLSCWTAIRARSTRRAPWKRTLAELNRRASDGAFLIDVPDDAIVQRAIGRVLCPNCGAIYHLQFKPPSVAGICDICRSVLVVRDDDTPSTVRHRLTVYHRITAPVIEFYKQKNLLAKRGWRGETRRNFGRATCADRKSLVELSPWRTPKISSWTDWSGAAQGERQA